MPRFRGLLAMVIASAVAIAACGGASTDTSAPTTASPPVLPDGCDQLTGSLAAAAVLKTIDHPCTAWVDMAMGRAVRGSTGSASLWTRRTPAATGLVVGAVHTLGEGWFGSVGTEISETIVDPGDQVGVPRLHLVLADGSGPDPLASPLFGFYNPAIAAERNGNRMQDVLPLEDFYIGVVDLQKIPVEGPVPVPEPIQRGQVPVYDPAGITVADSTWSTAAPGDLVLMLGYPNATGELTMSVGRVLDDDEAAAAVDHLAELGDVEGTVAFDPGVEMFIEGAAEAGMSGGPVVDAGGSLVGILVRATDEHDGVQYVRAVQMSYVAARLEAALLGLSEDERRSVDDFLES